MNLFRMRVQIRLFNSQPLIKFIKQKNNNNWLFEEGYKLDEKVNQIRFMVPILIKLSPKENEVKQKSKLNNQTYLEKQNECTIIELPQEDKNKSKSMWKFLIFEAEKSILKENYLETYLTTKVEEINASKSERELNLMVPGFVIKSTLKLKEEEDFKQNLIHLSSIRCNLLSSSISRSDSIADQETKIITLSQENPENGFVFCLCYCPEAKIVKVMAGSWIGFQDQTIYDKFSSDKSQESLRKKEQILW